MSKKVIHENPWFTLEQHTLHDNSDYFLVNKQPSVFIIAENCQKKILLVHEYRYPIHKIIWQLPAGMVEHNKPLLSAKHELLEESGLRANKWKRLGSFYVAPGHENTKIIVFLAQELTSTSQKQEKNIKKIQIFSHQEIQKMISKNEVECGISLAALNLFLMRP